MGTLGGREGNLGRGGRDTLGFEGGKP